MTKTPQVCKTGKKIEKDNGTGVPQEKKSNNRDDLSFSIVMEQRHLSGDFRVDLPKSFVKNMEIGTKETMLDVDCILWTLKLVIYPNPVRGELSLGWEEFARDHSLKLGDVCTFKMIINNDELLIFEVSIMRGLGVCSRSNGDDEIPSKRKEKSKLSSSQPPKKMKKLENFTGKSKQSMPKENGTKCLGKPSSSNPREVAEKANIRCGSKIPQLNGPIPDPYNDVLSTPKVSIMSGSSVCSERNDDNEIPRKRKEKSTLSSSQPRKKTKKVKNLTQNTGKENKGEGDDLFFSIVMEQTHVSGDYRVAMPSTFSDKYLTDWEGNITLNSEDGETWSVGYNSVYMKKSIVVRLSCRGWRKFALANNLEIGDKCVFEAIDQNPTELKVVIFRENQDGNKMSKDISFGKEFTTVNPYFKVTLSPTSLHTYITIPARFLEKYINQSLKKARLQVENKVFEMKISFQSNRFVSGVPAFADQNCLKVGDVCYFELIDGATVLFKVSIFRKP